MIDSVQAVKNLNQNDFVFGKFKDNHRLTENFEEINCLFGDVDDGFSIKEFSEMFKDVEFYLFTSRSHQKPKNGCGAEDRYHVIFSIGRVIKIKNEFDELIHKMHDKYPFFCQNSKDVTRFFFGNKETEVFYNQGTMSIVEDLRNYVAKASTSSVKFENITISPKIKAVAKKAKSVEKNMEEQQEVQEVEKIKEGNRHQRLLSYLGTRMTVYQSEDDFVRMGMEWNEKNCEVPLPEEAVAKMVRHAYQLYHSADDDTVASRHFIDQRLCINWFDRYFIKITIGNKECVFETAEGLTSAKVIAEFCKAHLNKTVFVPAKGKDVPAAQFWLEHTDNVYKKVVFDPDPDYVPKKGILNIWKGWKYAPQSNGKASSYINFIKEVICANNTEIFDYILDYMAWKW